MLFPDLLRVWQGFAALRDLCQSSFDSGIRLSDLDTYFRLNFVTSQDEAEEIMFYFNVLQKELALVSKEDQEKPLGKGGQQNGPGKTRNRGRPDRRKGRVGPG